MLREDAVMKLCTMPTTMAARLVKQMGRDTEAADLALGVMACRNHDLYETVMDDLTRSGWF